MLRRVGSIKSSPIFQSLVWVLAQRENYAKTKYIRGHDWTSQLYTQLKSSCEIKAWKKKKSGLNGIRTHLREYTELTTWCASSWLDSSVDRARHCTGIADIMGSIPAQARIFFKINFTTAQSRERKMTKKHLNRSPDTLICPIILSNIW